MFPFYFVKFSSEMQFVCESLATIIFIDKAHDTLSHHILRLHHCLIFRLILHSDLTAKVHKLLIICENDVYLKFNQAIIQTFTIRFLYLKSLKCRRDDQFMGLILHIVRIFLMLIVQIIGLLSLYDPHK